MTEKKKPIVTKRMVDLRVAQEISDPKERLVELNKALQGLHFSHNEVRRIMPMIIEAITEIVTKKAGRPKKETE